MFDFSKSPYFKISTISEATHQMLQGVAGGFYIANQVLKTAGGHSNRTSNELYDSMNGSDTYNEQIEMDLDRLAAQINLITNEIELKSGIIMLMSQGVLYGNWTHFNKLDTNFNTKKFLNIWNNQMKFEHPGQLINTPDDNQLLKMTNDFNDLHKEVNGIITDYYEGIEKQIDDRFNSLLDLLGQECNMGIEEYKFLNANRHQLLARVKNENKAMRLLKDLSKRSKNSSAIWNEYLDTKKSIDEFINPQKRVLNPKFKIKKHQQYEGELKFCNHFAQQFGDLSDLLSRINLEVV